MKKKHHYVFGHSQLPLPLAICSKGLGECQLSLAKSLMDDCRDGGAIDLIHQAIKNLFR